MAYTIIFLLKRCEWLLHLQQLFTFSFRKNTYEFDIILIRTVIILTTNKLVKLTMFEQLGPEIDGMYTLSKEATVRIVFVPSYRGVYSKRK